MNKVAATFRLLLLAVGILLCVALVGLFWASDTLPRAAAERFGPPGRSLGFPQRLLYAARVMASQRSLLRPLDARDPARPFAVQLGEPVASVAARLEDERFIHSADAFRTFLVYAGMDTGVQAGRYQLSAAMTPVEIARALQDPVPAEVTFVILAGWRAEEIAAALPTSGLTIDQGELMRLVRNPPADILPAGFPPLESLEGFLLPGTYQVKRETGARGLLELFLQRFDEAVTPEMRAGYASQGLDLEGAVALASIVEREAVIAEEQPLIASVFYNRLAQGMRLDSDPTVQYALGYQFSAGSWWKNPLTRSDLQVESRYNTYRYTGLPPGPICNPGIGALQAVAAPAESGYFFFRARCDGTGRHAFAITYQEHLQNACP